jgi:hypothetical protein
MKLDELVGKYIELRDRKATIKAKYDAKIDAVDAILDKIEVVLLKTFEETGQNSANTDAGTAYKATRVSCTIADKDAFLDYVRSQEAWELADVRASKTGIEQYKGVNNDLPPGVNWRETVVVNVNRPKH